MDPKQPNLPTPGATLHCAKCCSDWVPRVVGALPVRCPRCGMPRWWIPKKSRIKP